MKSTFKCLLLLGSVLLAAGTASAAGGRNKPEKIVLGCIQDLTSASGSSARKGAEAAAAMINAAGGVEGVPVELKVYDVKSDPREVLPAFIRLADQDKASAVIVPSLGSADYALANLAAAKKVPVLGSSLDEGLRYRKDGNPQPYLFLPRQPASQFAEAIAGYAYFKLGYRKAALICDSSDAAAAAEVKAFMAQWKKLGGIVAGEYSYKKGEKDFTREFEKIRGSDADCLFLSSCADDLVSASRQAGVLGLSLPFLGGPGFSPPFRGFFAASGITAKVYFADRYSAAETAGLRENYRNTYNEEPTSLFYFGYDSVLLVSEAVKHAESADPRDVRTALEQTKSGKRFAGTLAFMPVVYAYEEESFTEVGRFTAEDGGE